MRKKGRFDRRSGEKASAFIHSLMKEQNFKSTDEMNSFVDQYVRGRSVDDMELPASTPLERAQNTMWDAFDEASRTKRIAMAKEALAISEDCADAYNLLAEDDAKTVEDRIVLYTKALGAGMRTLGQERFETDAGNFWGILETRPYMRAASGLAESLWQAGKTTAAIELWEQLLILNPNDNQGIRYSLAPALVSLGQYAKAGALLKKFDDDTGAWTLYSRALLLFRQQGDSIAAQEALEEAMLENEHVLFHLFNPKLSRNHKRPSSYSPGSSEEAFLYALDWRLGWEGEPSALVWVLRHLKRANQRKRVKDVFPGLIDSRN